ncbi:beta-ketoacyl-[acyl-carrier-protein] synthase family protein [Enterobacteriaceae bacterium ESL0689]|nr:beta-ketoacyl-[acyl-carrier-protein] synthase family protein [Enterobacteriaceae bacterium ESL0689]
MKEKTVAVMGLGTLTRDTVGLPALWQYLLAGGALPAAPKHFDSTDFRAQSAYTVDPQALWQQSLQASWPLDEADYQRLPCAGYGWLAAQEALQQAGITPEMRAQMGISMATTSGGTMDRFAASQSAEEAQYATLDGAATLLARLLDAGGPVSVFSCACVSSVAAFSHAFERIRQGDMPLMLVGGCDQVREADFAGFNALRAIAHDACRPFDSQRKGMVMGDGAAMMVLEDLDHARARGATPLAIFRSCGLAADGHHLTAPIPDGLVRAMRQALRSVGDERPGYINCHGTGTQANDSNELQAMQQVFGQTPQSIVISSTKSGTGHLLGSAGALEAVLSIQILREQCVPPMATCQSPVAEMNFRIPDTTHPLPLNTPMVMSNSLGFGGLNGSLIFSHYQE